MRTLSKCIAVAFVGTIAMASCSRPQAYFQPTAREQFKTTQPSEAVAVSPMETVKGTESVSSPVVTPAEQVIQAKQVVSQVEAYVRNDSKLASNKKLAKRMARLNELMATATDKAVSSATVASAKKMTFMERTMLKKMDKKIKNHVAPDQTKAMNSNVRLGLIIGIIGLILLLLGTGALSVIGLIGLIVGLVLIVLGVINS